MNTKNFFVAFTALFITCSINAQLLWKVSGNGLTQSSYLFGTHHLIDKEQIKDFDKILALSNQTDAVVGEMDMSDPGSLQMKMMQGGMMSGTTIKQLLSPEDYALADNEFNQLMGTGLGQLGMMKPMVLGMMYEEIIYSQAYGLTKQPEAVDMLFQNNAKTNNKKIIGLETVEQQMDALLNSIPPKRQAEIMMKEIKEKQKVIDLFLQETAAYLSGDMTKIEVIDQKDDSMTPEEKKIINDNRNSNWLKQLPDLMKNQSCFIAVGCLHLAGKNGLVAQLKNAGYTVEPVVL
jgi:hypothetical protein